MRFATIVRTDDFSESISEYVIRKCIEFGWNYDRENPELIISIGGDGTLLRGIHKYLLNDRFHKNPEFEEMPLLEIKTSQDSDLIYALNEIRIESVSKTLSLDVYIDGEFFEHCNGSGICISTQAGSTAINRALQGAVIDDGLRILQLCEIMPIAHKNHHSLRNPYIMRLDRQIMIRGKSLALARACFDHLDQSLNDVEELYIKTSEKKVRFARYRNYSYLKRLKNLY